METIKKWVNGDGIYPILLAAITGGFGGQILDYVLDSKEIDLKHETISIQVLQEVNKTCREENKTMRAENAVLRADFLNLKSRLDNLESN